MKVRKSKKLVAGVGINDADYQLNVHDEDGKLYHCPYHRSWSALIGRLNF